MKEEYINRPEVLAEVRAVFTRYEEALVTNNTRVLDELFWDDERVVRYGNNEQLYGMEDIRRFRQQRSSKGLARTLTREHIVTYGYDFATVWTEFERPAEPRTGRQTQAWARFPDGWKIVAAHVSRTDD